MARPAAYKVDGKRVPSVTTITSRFADKGGLLWWANQIGLGDHDSCASQEECRKCGRRPGLTLAEGRDPAADTGKLAHALIEMEIRDDFELDLEEFRHLSDAQRTQADGCLASYKRWVSNGNVDYVGTELSLVSNVHGFGGTLDACGFVDGRFALIDWKTSNGIYADYLAQLAGYVILLEEHEIGPPVEVIDILRFSKEVASFEHRSFERKSFQPAIDFFLTALSLHGIDKQMKKMMK